MYGTASTGDVRFRHRPKIDSWRAGSYSGRMEVHFTPDTEKRLAALAAKTGRAPEELLEDAIPYLEELAGVREMLTSRYDDLKSGRVKPIRGEEIEAYFRDKSAAARGTQKSD